MENKVKTIDVKEKLAVKTKVAAYARVSTVRMPCFIPCLPK